MPSFESPPCHAISRRDAPPLPTEPGLVHVVGAAILRPRLCLVARRAPHVRSPGRWEFPGGKVEDGEAPRQALERELREELSIQVQAGDFLGRGLARQPHPSKPRTIVLDVYRCRWRGGGLRLSDHDAVRWIQASQVESLPWAEADVPILDALERVLGNRHAIPPPRQASRHPDK